MLSNFSELIEYFMENAILYIFSLQNVFVKIIACKQLIFSENSFNILIVNYTTSCKT